MLADSSPRRPPDRQAASEQHSRRKFQSSYAGVSLAIALVLVGNRCANQTPGEVTRLLDPTPAPDRLATPVMPASPTQIDTGRQAYYTNCMPCHGDRGQGLTDEWRAVWVEDHQNCWAHGCHGSRPDDEGYPIPRVVPALSGSPQALARFPTSGDLFDYLHRTQPPQRPGALSDEEYWALTAFLLHENGRLPADTEVGPGATEHADSRAGAIGAIAFGLLLVTWLVLWAKKRTRKTSGF